MSTGSRFVHDVFDQTLATYRSAPLRLTPEYALKIVNDFHVYFKERADNYGRDRKMPYLATVQTSLSNLKKRLRLSGLPEEFLQHLRLNKEDSTQLIAAKAQSVVVRSIDLPTVDSDAIVVDCREKLTHRDPYLRLIALAALTGRRTAELLFCASFEPPKEKHKTAERYWACVRGFCKQRHDGSEPPMVRDVPLLESRDRVCAAIESVRRELPADSVEEVNAKYAKPIQRRMLKYMPSSIKNIHNLRKFYALTCFQYFNDRSCSLPRFASEVLGHKTLSSTVITYLSFHVNCKHSLSFR
jgi:integrase